MIHPVCLVLFVLLFALPNMAVAEEPIILRYAKKLGRVDPTLYPIQLMRLAMDHSGKAYILEPSDYEMTESRARTLLAKDDQQVTIDWFGTSREFESRFRAIYVPLQKGLLGYRLFMIRKQLQPVFSAIESLDDLSALTALQAAGWSDVEILQGSGLTVATAPYPRLYPMLVNGRGDYFPRGAAEAFAELAVEQKHHPSLKVEDSLCLIYPFAWFFFVNKTDTALYDALSLGLKRAYADGSFDKLFYAQPDIQATIAKARLAERRCFTIENPLLTPQAAQIPKRFWLDFSSAN